MKHINFKLTHFPIVILDDLNPLPPPPVEHARRILPDGTFRIYFDSLDNEINRIVDIVFP